jgi:hypothetical protein
MTCSGRLDRTAAHSQGGPLDVSDGIEIWALEHLALSGGD